MGIMCKSFLQFDLYDFVVVVVDGLLALSTCCVDVFLYVLYQV